jgi:5-methylcytosine-specific restriction endonuclease McrA
MPSQIADHRDLLEQRHYIRKAGTDSYWFDFSARKLQGYRDRFGDDFCLIIYGSESQDDAYILPFSAVGAIFSADHVDDRRRWIGNVKGHLLRLNPGRRSMSISGYYNAFQYIEETTPEQENRLAYTEVLEDVGDEIDLHAIRQRVAAFNEQYQTVTPFRRMVLSRQIARPGAITDYLKQLRGFTCQLCGAAGFRQRNGTLYIEAHHIVELHHLIPGSYCSDNIVIVCPTCRRQLQYADTSYRSLPNEKVEVEVNGLHRVFDRNIISGPSGSKPHH